MRRDLITTRIRRCILVSGKLKKVLSPVIVVLMSGILVVACAQQAPPTQAPKAAQQPAAAKPVQQPVAATVAPKPTQQSAAAKPAQQATPASAAKPDAPAAAPASTKTYNWKWLVINPIGSVGDVNEAEPFIKRVSELSNGRIKITKHPPGQVAGTREYLDMVAKGAVEMATLPLGSFADRMPLATVTGLPYLFKDYQTSFQVTRELHEQVPELQAYWKRFDQVPLLWVAGHGTTVQTTKPIGAISDLKGLKIRSVGGGTDYMIKGWGAVPVVMGAGDVYQALQTGVVDGAAVAITTQEGFRWYEIAPHFLRARVLLLAPPTAHTISAKLLYGLPQADRDIVLRAAKDAQEQILQWYTREYEDSAKRMEAKGLTVKVLSEAQTQELLATSEQVWAVWAKDYPGGSALLKDTRDRLAARR